jgi:hypothetical protein
MVRLTTAVDHRSRPRTHLVVTVLLLAWLLVVVLVVQHQGQSLIHSQHLVELSSATWLAVGLFEGSQFGTAEFARREAIYGFKFEHILRFHSIYDLRYWEVKQILDTGHKVIVVSSACV